MEDIVDESTKPIPILKLTPFSPATTAPLLICIRTTTLAGNPPHVALTEMVQAIALDELNAVVDLTSYIEAEGPGFYDDFIDGFWRGFQLEGKILGLPFQHSVPLAYYNLDALAEAGLDPDNPPTTWDETKKAAEALLAADPNRLPIVSPGDAWVLQGLVESNSGSYVKDLETPSFDDQR